MKLFSRIGHFAFIVAAIWNLGLFESSNIAWAGPPKGTIVFMPTLRVFDRQSGKQIRYILDKIEIRDVSHSVDRPYELVFSAEPSMSSFRNGIGGFSQHFYNFANDVKEFFEKTEGNFVFIQTFKAPSEGNGGGSLSEIRWPNLDEASWRVQLFLDSDGALANLSKGDILPDERFNRGLDLFSTWSEPLTRWLFKRKVSQAFRASVLSAAWSRATSFFERTTPDPDGEPLERDSNYRQWNYHRLEDDGRDLLLQ